METIAHPELTSAWGVVSRNFFHITVQFDQLLQGPRGDLPIVVGHGVANLLSKRLHVLWGYGKGEDDVGGHHGRGVDGSKCQSELRPSNLGQCGCVRHSVDHPL